MISILGRCSECCNCPVGVAVFSPALDISVITTSKTAAELFLYGFSGYADGLNYGDPAPEGWGGKYLKWRTRTFSGVQERKDGTCAGLPGGGSFRSEAVPEGAAEIDYCGTATTTGAVKRYDNDSASCDAPDTLVSTYSDVSSLGIGNGIFVEESNPEYVSETKTLTVRTITGRGLQPGQGTAIYNDVVETLSDVMTIADAMTCEGSPTIGAQSCARTGRVTEGTNPEDTAPITFYGSTTVTIEITLNGAPSTTYPVLITYSNWECAEGDESEIEPDFIQVADTFDYVDITTDGSGEAIVELEIPQPVKPNSKRCLVSVEQQTGDEYVIRFKIASGGCLRVKWFERIGETDTEKCAEWDGVTPEDYDPDDQLTWPYVGPYEVSDSEMRVLNIETFCDCSTCP